MYSGICAGDTADASPTAALAIGCFASIGRDRVADLLVGFGRTAPAVDFGVHEMPRAALLPALAAGKLDLVVMPTRPLTDRPSLPLWRDRAMVALATDHPLAAKNMLRLADLADETFLVSRQEHCGGLHRFLAERLGPNAALTGVLCGLGLPRILDRVAAGRELALVAETWPVSGAISLRPLADARATFSIRAYWRDRSPSGPLSHLLQHCKLRAS